ncbi:MAG TPA: YetF domain-containing protein [Acidimicrobiales bacterium]|nr:YetF domain-containing protein [Acidimicrobiales bacterium]
MIDRLWSGPTAVLPTVVGTVVLFAAVLTMVRLAGRRTLAQISAFDVLVTIAIGSVVAGAALPPQPKALDGALVVGTLLALQTLVAAARQRSDRLQRVLDFAPERIVEDGELSLSRSLASAQLTRDEVEARLRQSGVRDLGEVSLVILEPGGKLSVFMSDDSGGHR